MRYKSFDELKSKLTQAKRTPVCAVVCAQEDHVIDSIIEAYKSKYIVPVLIGDETKIKSLLAERGNYDFEVIQADSKEEAANKGIELVKDGKAQCLMKGILETSTFMKAVLRRESDLKTDGVVSMISFRTLPNYKKLIAFADAGIMPHPSFEQKKKMIDEAVSVFNKLGMEEPKIAVLCPSEQITEKALESVEAAELKRLNQEGKIKGCIVEGPISFDLAINPDAAKIKGFDSPVAGDADMLLFPNLTAANVAAKLATFITNEPSGIFITGTKVPVIVTSRASSVETKQLCILLAALQAV